MTTPGSASPRIPRATSYVTGSIGGPGHVRQPGTDADAHQRRRLLQPRHLRGEVRQRGATSSGPARPAVSRATDRGFGIAVDARATLTSPASSPAAPSSAHRARPSRYGQRRHRHFPGEVRHGGNFLWARRAGGAANKNCLGFSVALNSAGTRVHIGGYVDGPTTFPSPGGTPSLTGNPNYLNAFLAPV
jgi:hypothetical protein